MYCREPGIVNEFWYTDLSLSLNSEFIMHICKCTNVWRCQQQTPREKELFLDADIVHGQKEAQLIEFPQSRAKMAMHSSQSAADT